MLAWFEFAAKYDRTRIVQALAVMMVQIVCLERSPINADFQLTCIGAGDNERAQCGSFKVQLQFGTQARLALKGPVVQRALTIRRRVFRGNQPGDAPNRPIARIAGVRCGGEEPPAGPDRRLPAQNRPNPTSVRRVGPDPPAGEGPPAGGHGVCPSGRQGR